MSTTRSQKRRNEQQGDKDVSEGFISPIVVENPCSSNQDDEVAGPSKPKSPRIENSLLESLRASLKEEITSEIKNLLIESQKEMLKLLKPETRGIIRENTEEEIEEETRSFYTPTKSVRISSTQNDPIACRNMFIFWSTFQSTTFQFRKCFYEELILDKSWNSQGFAFAGSCQQELGLAQPWLTVMANSWILVI